MAGAGLCDERFDDRDDLLLMVAGQLGDRLDGAARFPAGTAAALLCAVPAEQHVGAHAERRGQGRELLRLECDRLPLPFRRRFRIARARVFLSSVNRKHP